MVDEGNMEGALPVKDAALKEKADKRKKKVKLQLMIEAATRKALQQSQEMENRGKKRVREKTTLRSF